MASDSAFAHLKCELQRAVDFTPPGDPHYRYAVAFRRLCVELDYLAALARKEHRRELWSRLAHILNTLDEQISLEFAGEVVDVPIAKEAAGGDDCSRR